MCLPALARVTARPGFFPKVDLAVYRNFLSAACAVGLLATPLLAQSGPYSAPSGITDGAIDNPIHRNEISQFEFRIVDYSPAPGVGANFNDPTTGIASLGDLYSPIARPDGLPNGFQPQYQPAIGTRPPFHAGNATDALFTGDIRDPSDRYGFLTIDNPGSITLGFDTAITNGTGADFAVFENGFSFGNGFLAELAHVEVSTNGLDYIRFPSLSFNGEMVSSIGTMQLYDMTNVYNLAGKHAANWGTPFDLQELADHTLVTSGLVDLSSIHYVRLVDVIGSGPLFDSDNNLVWAGDTDSAGNPILDNWVTFDSAGFDYVGLSTGAVGVINSATAVPEPGSMLALSSVLAAGYWRSRQRRKSSTATQQAE